MKSMYKPEFWQNLLLICEIISNGYFLVSLDFLLIFVVFCGIIVTINKNPIISVIFLIGLFSGIVSYLIILGLSFIGLSYKMGIYVPSKFYFSYFDVDRRWNSSQIVR